jgi:hypothetical protein
MKWRNYPYQQEATSGDAGGQGGQQAQQQQATQQQQTVLNSQQAQQQAVKSIWPEAWRLEMAGHNPDEAKRLERFNSPRDTYKSYRELEQRVSSGELKLAKPFPEKGTPEEQTAWRKENGIPEAPDKYDLNMEGVVIGDEDKPIIEGFLKYAHKANYTPQQVHAGLDWYYDHVEKQAEARAESDKQVMVASQDALRAEWGNEYRPNINRIHALLDTAPPGVKDKLLSGRMANGVPVGSDPDILRFLASVSREINPVTTVVPGAGANIASAIEDEISQIEKLMKENRAAYNQDEKKQARLRELYAARDRAKSRAA